MMLGSTINLGNLSMMARVGVKEAIEQLKTDKKPEDIKDDDPLGHEFYDALTTVLDIL